MAKRGRPRQPDGLIVRLNVRLHEGTDDDLIHFFRSVPLRRRVTAVKAALRAGGIKIALSDESSDEEFLEAAEAFLR